VTAGSEQRGHSMPPGHGACGHRLWRIRRRSANGIIAVERPHEVLQVLQLLPILNHSSPDIPNSSSSCWTELEGGCIAHAAGAGGFGHGCIVTGNDDFDAQPAAVSISARVQIFKAAV